MLPNALHSGCIQDTLTRNGEAFLFGHILTIIGHCQKHSKFYEAEGELPLRCKGAFPQLTVMQSTPLVGQLSWLGGITQAGRKAVLQ